MYTGIRLGLLIHVLTSSFRSSSANSSCCSWADINVVKSLSGSMRPENTRTCTCVRVIHVKKKVKGKMYERIFLGTIVYLMLSKST